MSSIERIHDVTERKYRIRFHHWSIILTTSGSNPEQVHIGLHWADKIHPTHDIIVPRKDLAKAFEELGITDAQTSPERESARDSSAPSSSADASVREASRPQSWEEEKLASTRSQSTGGGRSRLSPGDLGYDESFTRG